MSCVHKNQLLIVATLSVVMLLSIPATASAFRVLGQVINGTTGLPVSAAIIKVINPSGGMLTEHEVETIDDLGHYEVDDLDEQNPVYLLRVSYEGVNYTELIRYHGHDSVTIDIKVYDRTSSWDDIQVSIPHVVVSRSLDTLSIEKFIQINNNTSPPKTIYDQESQFVFYLPEDAIRINSLSVQSLGIPLPTTPVPTEEPGFYRIDHPIKPGVTDVALSFDLPYQDSEYHYSEPLKYGLQQMTIIARDPTIMVTSETTAVGDAQDFHGFKAYKLAGLTTEKPLTLTFTGGSRVTRAAPQIFTVPNRTQRLSIATMLLLVLVLVGFLILEVRRNPSPDLQKQALRGQREELLGQLARLDDLYKTGTISEQLYKIKRSELVNALAQIYYRIEFDGGVTSQEVSDQEGAAGV
ncbi:MAG: hypothetical protein OEN01_03835 [Candidatus Krumholzibacteria bacterium]|nr:hypothetical protein [Candidatus Krumholzibacteria bacterium]